MIGSLCLCALFGACYLLIDRLPVCGRPAPTPEPPMPVNRSDRARHAVAAAEPDAGVPPSTRRLFDLLALPHTPTILGMASRKPEGVATKDVSALLGVGVVRSNQILAELREAHLLVVERDRAGNHHYLPERHRLKHGGWWFAVGPLTVQFAPTEAEAAELAVAATQPQPQAKE